MVAFQGIIFHREVLHLARDAVRPIPFIFALMLTGTISLTVAGAFDF